MEEDLAAQDEVELTRGSTSPMKSSRAFSPLNVEVDLSSLSQLQVSFSSVSTGSAQAGKLHSSWNGRETLNSNGVGKRQIADISNASTATARHDDVHRDLDYSSYCDVSSNNSSESNYPGYGIDSRTSMSVSGEEDKDDVVFGRALAESREEDTESLMPMSTPSERAASMSQSLLNISSGLASESITRDNGRRLQLFEIGSWRSAANSSMESEGSANARFNNSQLMHFSNQRLNLSQATTESPNSMQNRSLTVRFERVEGEGLPTQQSVSFESLFIEEEASDDSEEEEEDDVEGEEDEEGLNEVDETFVTAKQSFISSSGYSPSPSHATLTPAPPPIPYHGKIGSSGGRGPSRHFFRPTSPSNTSLPHKDTFSPEAQDEAVPRLSALSLKLNAFVETIASRSSDEAQRGDLRFDVLSSTESSHAFYQDEQEEGEVEDERSFNLPLNHRVSSRGERYVRDDSNSNADFLFGNDADDEEEAQDEEQAGSVDDSFEESSSEAKRIIESEIAEMKRRLLEVVHSSSLLGREEEAVIAASLTSSMSREEDTSSPLVGGALEKFLTSNYDRVQIEATNDSRDATSSSRSVDEKIYADEETDMDILLQGQSLASSAFSGMSKSHSLISSHRSANLSGGNLSSSPSRLSHTSMLSEFALRGEQSEEEEEEKEEEEEERSSRFDEDV